MNAERFWYLYEQKPVHVLAEQTSDLDWYLPELNISVDGSDLFRSPIGVLRALRRRIDAEIKRRAINDERARKVPLHGKPSKVDYLRVVEGGLSTQ